MKTTVRLASIVAVLSMVFTRSTADGGSIQATGTVTVINGFVVGADLLNGGSGYLEPPPVSVADPSGSNAVIVAAISASGVVTNLTMKNAGSHYSAGAALVIAAPPANPNPADIHVMISPSVTDNLRTWTSGTNYPSGYSFTNYAGITFYLTGYPGITNGLGTVYTGLGSVTAPSITNFPVSITNAATVYTLMNSYDGQLGSTNGTMDFYGSQGAHARFEIVQGLNIRDHYNGTYQNMISSNFMSLYWGTNRQVRLDCQGWMLPTNFCTQTLTNIQVRSFGNRPNGVPTVAAITVRTTGPTMTVNQMGDQAVCFWPSTPTNYVLQTAAATSNPVWTTAATAPSVANNQFAGASLISATNQFYRLISVP